MMIFCKFLTFYIKISIFTENANYFARFLQLSALFRPARPQCARAVKTNEIPYIFGDFWSPRADFAQIVIFATKCRKCINNDFYRVFRILGENEEFHENAGIAKTSIIPKEYQGLRRVDGPQDAKSHEFTENHGFH